MSYDSVSMITRVIGPDEAKQILENHSNFRKPSQLRVRMYARDMSAGTWGLSIILFSEDGTLWDGQHRLQAVIKSGVPQLFVIIKNWPDKSKYVVDIGQNRTKGQVAKHAGVCTKNVKKSLALVAYLAINEPLSVVINSFRTLTYQETMKRYAEDQAIIEKILSVAHSAPALTAGCFARAYKYYTVTKNHEAAELVLDALTRYVSLRFDDRSEPIRLLRRRIDEDPYYRSGAYNQRISAYQYAAAAIEHYISGTSIKRLCKVTADPYVLEQN